MMTLEGDDEHDTIDGNVNIDNEDDDSNDQQPHQQHAPTPQQLAHLQALAAPQVAHARREHHLLSAFWRKAGHDAAALHGKAAKDVEFSLAVVKQLMASVRWPPPGTTRLQFDPAHASNRGALMLRVAPVALPTRSSHPIKVRIAAPSNRRARNCSFTHIRCTFTCVAGPGGTTGRRPHHVQSG